MKEIDAKAVVASFAIGKFKPDWPGKQRIQVPRVLFLDIYLVFHYFPRLILFPKPDFNLDRSSVSQALMQSCLFPP